jgi:hypothetical protein
MLELTNNKLLSHVVDEAIQAAVAHSNTDQVREAWVRAILKAANLMQTGDLTFWQFDKELGELTLLSQSNNSYIANGTCECKAYSDFHIPCWHRAAARLLARYYAEEESLPCQ